MNRTAAMDANNTRLRRRRSAEQPAAGDRSAPNAAAARPDPRPAGSWHTLLLACASAALLWAALPPLGWWPLAWVTPLPWLWLVLVEKMPGRRPHAAIWLAAFLHWLAVLQGIRLAHPALYGGWIALSAYLAFYPLLWIVLTRVAVHRVRVPVTFAAPAVWVGLELVRSYFATGFSAAMLGHTQYQNVTLIQISDLFGGYGVSFVVMLAAAALGAGVPWQQWLRRPLGTAAESLPAHWRPLPLASAAIVLLAVVAYGQWRLGQHAALAARGAGEPKLRVALLQESVETIFDYDGSRSLETFQRYMRLAERAIAQQGDLDVIVWPESAFNSQQPILEIAPNAAPPAGLVWSEEQFAEYKARAPRAAQLKAQGAAVRLGESAYMLTGTDVFVLGESMRHYNSAALYSPSGELKQRYDKSHRVMFGEYIPLGDRIPLLYEITPMSGGLTPGERAESFDIQGIRLAPTICFESVVPHLVRRQVKELAERNETPDALVNLTNDGWFKGSSILDLHHICGVFRAVENRRPLLVAANIGITSHIDSTGVVRGKLPRMTVDVLYAEVPRSPWGLTPYTRWGDWAAGLCLLFTAGIAVLLVAGGLRRGKVAAAKAK